MINHRSSRSARRGAIAIELVILLPLLMFFAVIGVDYARIFSRAMILASASRNACVYAAQDSDKAADTAGIRAVAMKDLTDVSPTPTVTVTKDTTNRADGFKYVKVTVTMTFKTITNFPGVPNSSQLSRSTEMRICPKTPKAGTY